MEYLPEIFSAVCALLIFYWQRQQKKRDALIEQRGDARKKESMLALELSVTTGQMCRIQVEALHGGKVNGNVDRAVKAYDEAANKYQRFLNEQAQEHLAERR